MLAETNHLIVLANDLGSAFGEVECERGLVSAKIVDVEYQFLREVFRRTPDDPADARIHLEDRKPSSHINWIIEYTYQTVLVARDIN